MNKEAIRIIGEIKELLNAVEREIELMQKGVEYTLWYEERRHK